MNTPSNFPGNKGSLPDTENNLGSSEAKIPLPAIYSQNPTNANYNGGPRSPHLAAISNRVLGNGVMPSPLILPPTAPFPPANNTNYPPMGRQPEQNRFITGYNNERYSNDMRYYERNILPAMQYRAENFRTLERQILPALESQQRTQNQQNGIIPNLGPGILQHLGQPGITQNLDQSVGQQSVGQQSLNQDPFQPHHDPMLLMSHRSPPLEQLLAAARAHVELGLIIVVKTVPVADEEFRKKRGRPKKLILDPASNQYIDSSHENYKRLNKILKESLEAEKRMEGISVTKNANLRTLDEKDVQTLLEKKDRRGRPRKFPIEQTGLKIRGIRVNGSLRGKKKPDSPDEDKVRKKRGRPRKEPAKEPAKESAKEPAKEPAVEPAKEPEVGPK